MKRHVAKADKLPVTFLPRHKVKILNEMNVEASRETSSASISQNQCLNARRGAVKSI